MALSWGVVVYQLRAVWWTFRLDGEWNGPRWAAKRSSGTRLDLMLAGSLRRWAAKRSSATRLDLTPAGSRRRWAAWNRI